MNTPDTRPRGSWSLAIICKHGLGDKALEARQDMELFGIGTIDIPFDIEEACREMDEGYRQALEQRDQLAKKFPELLKLTTIEQQQLLERAERAEAEIDELRPYKVAELALTRQIKAFVELTQQAEIYRAIILKFLEHSRECADDYKYVYGDIVQEAHKALADWHKFKQGKGEE